MADDRLRLLERRFRETGSAEAEAAWLRERVRQGELAAWRLDVARHCGHPGLARPGQDPLAFGPWLAGLPFPRRRGRVVRDWVRVPLAGFAALAPVVEAMGTGAVAREAQAAIEACVVHGGCAPPVLDGLDFGLRDFRYERHPDAWEPCPPDVAATWFLSAATRFLRLGEVAGDLEDWARKALEPEGVWGVERGVQQAIERALPCESGRLWALRQAIAAELVPWALDDHDPLRARTEARRDGDAS